MALRLLCVLASLCILRVSSARAADSTLIQFEMEDQFKQVHTDSAFRGSGLVVLVADKGGKMYSRAWSPALRDSMAAWSWSDQVNVVGVAHMSGVPFFLKGMIKGKLPKEPNKWMLLDWKGKFYKAYECAEDTCNVLLFDARGELRHRLEVGPLEPASMDSIRGLISRSLLEVPPASGAATTPAQPD